MSTHPRNVIGAPVLNDDFYDRVDVVENAWFRLETDHLLLTAPRRVGKTSLMHRLHAEARGRGWLGAILVSAQGARDERGLLAELVARLATTPACEAAAEQLRMHSLKATFSRLRSISAASLKLEFAEQKDALGWEVLATELEAALMALPPGRRLLVMIDELPVFLMKLVKDERARGAADPLLRAHSFLEWFRDLRQGPAGRVNPVAWLVAGSVGLGPLARRHGWSGTINDLLPLPLGAFPADVADRFLADVAAGMKLALGDEARRAILDETGWCIPFYLHLFLSELRGLGHPPDPADVRAARDRLVGLQGAKHFAPWRERLDDELGPTDASAARALLDRVAQDPNGASPDTLKAAVEGFYDEASRDERRRWLLEVLEEDGYVLFESERWRFRSPLLRGHWATRLRR